MGEATFQLSTAPTIALDRCIPVLRRTIGRKRFLHSLGTLHVAVVLAHRYGENVERAATAGLLHDCGRLRTLEEVAAEMHRRGIEVPAEHKPYPKIWHALLSAKIAAADFAVSDEEILRAIRIHSTGEASMTRLDRILFVADYIEPMRRFEGLDELRALAHRDLNRAFTRVLEMKLGYVRGQNRPLHPASMRALEAVTHIAKGVELSFPLGKRLVESPGSATGKKPKRS